MRYTLLGVLMTLTLPFAAGDASAGDASAGGSRELALTDFGPKSRVSWMTVNDNVMGGRSRGGFRVDDGVLRFEGATNTNGGGFSSIRSRPVALNLQGYEGIRLRVRADGRTYTFRLTTSTSRQGRWAPSYWADFRTAKGDGWQVVDVPFERFRPRWRGSMLRGPKLDLRNVDSLGLMIYDKQDGPFRMDVDWIRAYRAPQAFTLSTWQWKKRPLVVFAPDRQDARLRKQLEAIQQDRAGFDERDMLLVVVTPTGGAGAVSLTAKDKDALRKRFGVKSDAFAVRLVGKDGTVKREATGPVAMDDVFEQIDGMPMRRAEQRSASR